MGLIREHPELLLLGGMILITMFMMSRVRKRRKRGGASIMTPHEQLERIKQARGMRGDLEQLMVEIQEMAKRMGAQLDAKSIRLEHLINQANQRIETLEKRSAPTRSSPGPGSSQPSATQETEVDGEPRQGMAGASSDHERVAVGTNPFHVDHTAPGMSTETLPADPLSSQVYQLADQGRDSQQIARELSEHVGKVELILALRNA